MLQSVGSQRVGHDIATEQQQTVFAQKSHSVGMDAWRAPGPGSCTLPVPSSARQFPPIPFCKVQTLSGYRVAAPTGSWGDSHSHHIQLLPTQHIHISVAVAGDWPRGTYMSPLGGSGAGCCQTPFHLLGFPCSACEGCTLCAI